jgi:hypothetical protein
MLFSITIFPACIIPIPDLTSILHLTNGGYASAGAAEDLLNTNTFLSPLSLGVKEVANFVHDHQEEPPKGELKL